MHANTPRSTGTVLVPGPVTSRTVSTTDYVNYNTYITTYGGNSTVLFISTGIDRLGLLPRNGPRTLHHTGTVLDGVSRLNFNGYAGAHTYRTRYPGGISVDGVTHLGHSFVVTGLGSWSNLSTGGVKYTSSGPFRRTRVCRSTFAVFSWCRGELLYQRATKKIFL